MHDGNKSYEVLFHMHFGYLSGGLFVEESQ
jgi:hypothetical protein